MEPESKIILITGANGGLGKFVTNSFLEIGAFVVGASRSIADSEFPSPRFAAIPAELSTGQKASELVETVCARWGRIDGLVHLVGGYTGGHPIAETDDASFERMLDLNLRSAFYMLRAVLPKMRAQGFGRIVAIGSKAAAEPSPMVGAYAASKAALGSLIRTVARENLDRGITANILLPAGMDTPANRAGNPGGDFSKWVDPLQVAKLAVYLMSDAASWINGAAIPVDGGA
jgi:NAD(P)-dependent dehydrogenase (short-subunit alcohol dehydrogenase family)